MEKKAFKLTIVLLLLLLCYSALFVVLILLVSSKITTVNTAYSAIFSAILIYL